MQCNKKERASDSAPQSLEAAGTDCITVAVRRERLIDAQGKNLLDFIDTRRYILLPNTAGCFTGFEVSAIHCRTI